MKAGTFLVLLMVAPLWAGNAHASSLTSCDSNEDVDVLDDLTVRHIRIKPGQTRDISCDSGCSLALENGQIESIRGHEAVVQEYGRFETLP